MIYLDYSATTPVAYEVMDSISKTTKQYIGNPNSLHGLGVKSKQLLDGATKQIAQILNIHENEIIYTSGATEANNMAIIGCALENHKKGKHIIVSKLEHPSIYSICDYLTSIGFEISYVANNEEGLIDFDDLKKLIRTDTILVSIGAVNSETGVRQPLKMIRQVIKKENYTTVFHSDLTQAIGKININFSDIDLASMSAHKFYGPKGIGILFKRSNIRLVPLLYGSSKNDSLKPGTPPLPLIVGLAKSLRLSLNDLEKRERFISLINEKIVDSLKKEPDIKINKTKYSIPHILNISLMNIQPETFIHAMEENDVYLGTNTACSKKDVSSSIMAIYNDKLRARHTIRISLSYMTTTEEVSQFISIFEEVYKNLNSLK